MTGQFQQVVKDAFATFVADITAAAEREAIEALRAAFARASRQTGDAVAPAAVPASDGRAHRRADRRAAAGVDRAAVRERVVACVREHPGWDPVQLGRSLAIFPSKLRRQLRELVNDGAIRFEEGPAKFGQRLRLYFVREPANGASERAEPAAVPTEPPALHVEAA
jgi:hypothetical protein